MEKRFYFYDDGTDGRPKRASVKERLAVKLQKFFDSSLGEFTTISNCYPEDLRSNHSSVQQDIASWQGRVQVNGMMYTICSWNSMSELIKSNVSLDFVGQTKPEINGLNEIVAVYKTVKQ